MVEALQAELDQPSTDESPDGSASHFHVFLSACEAREYEGCPECARGLLVAKLCESFGMGKYVSYAQLPEGLEAALNSQELSRDQVLARAKSLPVFKTAFESWVRRVLRDGRSGGVLATFFDRQLGAQLAHAYAEGAPFGVHAPRFRTDFPGAPTDAHAGQAMLMEQLRATMDLPEGTAPSKAGKEQPVQDLRNYISAFSGY